MATILITGGTGCIGSATVYKLLQSSDVEHVIIASRKNDNRTLKLWLNNLWDDRITFETLDISDYDSIARIAKKVNPTHIIHLGALVSPECASNHIKGMEINTGGTMAFFDVAETLPRLERFVFASSAAVYGRRSMYSQPVIKEDSAPAPPNHYGIWKLAGEHLARLFYELTQIPTVCLRLNATYGIGRDRGLTAAPTTALKSIALGMKRGKPIPFEMPYTGRENYHYVEDVGAHFSACALQPYSGYDNFNIKGETIEVSEFLKIAQEQAEELGYGAFAKLSVSRNAVPNLFVSDLSHDKIDRSFDKLPLTSIPEGIRLSIRKFYELAKDGTLEYPTNL